MGLQSGEPILHQGSSQAFAETMKLDSQGLLATEDKALSIYLLLSHTQNLGPFKGYTFSERLH